MPHASLRQMTLPMTTPRLSLLVLTTTFCTAAVASACGLQPPIQNSGTVTTPDGIQIAVLKQECSQTVETDWPGNDLVAVTIQIEVRNRTQKPLDVHRDGFRLVGTDGSAIPTSTWFASDSISLAPDEVRAFRLRFMSRGSLSCSKEIALESPSAIVRGTEIARIAPIGFVARQAFSGYGEPRQ